MITVIVCTIGRVAELHRFMSSLTSQTYKDFEVLVVDQNEDDRIVPVLDSYSGLHTSRLRSQPGLSRARNVALRRVAGEVICFPDDDCWYPPELLEAVNRWFQDRDYCSGVLTCLRDANGDPVGPRWPSNSCRASRNNIWFIGLSAVAFLRRDLVKAVGFFDEEIGVGARSDYQSGEESDYFLRALALGKTIWFEPSLTVNHPSLHAQERLRRTTYRYALGGGYVQRIHGYSLLYFANQVMRSFGGAAVSPLKADFANSHIYLLRAAGQLRGYFWGPRDMSRYRAQSH